MTGRSSSPALNQVAGRHVVRRIHWRTVMIPADWISAHRAARISRRCNEAREQAFRRMHRGSR